MELEYSPIEVRTKKLNKTNKLQYIKDNPQQSRYLDIDIPNLCYGDIFEIGEHRLIYGDSTDSNILEKLMNGKLANIVINDPPYNLDVNSKGIISVHIVKGKNFIDGVGKTDKEFSDWSKDWIQNSYACSSEIGTHFCFIDWRNVDILKQNYESVFGRKMVQMLIWMKNIAGMGGYYRNQYELILIFRKNTKNGHIKNFSFKDYRSNILQYPSANVDSFRSRENLLHSNHPTPKPLSLLQQLLLDNSNENDICLDLFCGSGSSLCACHLNNRICYCVEKDRDYIIEILYRILLWDNNLRVLHNGLDISDLFLDRIYAENTYNIDY